MKNKPELISFSDFLMIAPFYDIRSFFRPEIEFLKGGNEALQISGLIKEDQSELIEYHNRVAVLTIEGPLRPGRGWYYSTGYGDIQDAIDELLESDVKTVIQKIDSPGGTVKDAFETEDKFKELADKKTLISLVTGSATSGAALMTFPAHERYLASKTAQTGSIGVVTQHIDNQEWYKLWGEKRTSIAKGKLKDAGTDVRAYDEKAKEVFESAVSKLHGIFVTAAAEGLNKSFDFIAAQESAVYIGDDSFNQGFADGFKTLNELIEDHNSISPPERPAFYKIQNEVQMDINQLKADHPDVYQAAIKKGGDEREEAIKQTYIDQGEASGVLKERARMNAIDELCMSPEFTAKAKKESWSAEKSAAEYLKAEAGKKEEIKTNMEKDLNEPLASDSPDMPEKPETKAEDPKQEFEAKVQEKVETGMKRTDAIKAAIKTNPELHQSYIKAIQKGVSNG
jgi:ClpP class serine protease